MDILNLKDANIKGSAAGVLVGEHFSLFCIQYFLLEK